MRDRFVRTLLASARADAPSPGAQRRALERLELEPKTGSGTKLLSGMAVIALLATSLVWRPQVGTPSPTPVAEPRCTAGVEAPPCGENAARASGARVAPESFSGSSASGGPSGRSSGGA